MRVHKIVTCVIPANGTISNTQLLEGAQLAAIYMPAAWDAADLTFRVGLRSDDMKQLVDDAGAVKQIKVSASKAVALSGPALAGFVYVALVSTVSQTSARSLTLVGLR